MSSLDLAVIGNSAIAALVDRQARIVWCCFPRIDGDPIFNALLNDPDDRAESISEQGLFAIEIADFARSEQSYDRNTAVLRTRLEDTHGQALEIIDFCPRFRQFGRYHRPTSIFRIVRPVAGYPRIRVTCRPTFDYGNVQPTITRGSNHIRFVDDTVQLRLTTTAPVAYVVNRQWFVLEKAHHLILGADESLTSSVEETSRKFLGETTAYWQEFSRMLALPFEWQDAVIRAAITLKMCAYEETGAIVAALTTSIPEAPHTERNWDYRFCWLRDSFFVVHALNRLGATKTMEDYLSYITNIVAASKEGYLDPLFPITLDPSNLVEGTCTALRGYRGMGPVRIGNAAHSQVQNDGYGSLILAVAQTFFDRRLERPGDINLFHRLELLGEQAKARWNTPDAGLWELRTRARVHTFSALMCWAACDRLALIASQLDLPDRAGYWRNTADEIRDEIHMRAYNKEIGSFVESFGGEHLDASLLLMPELRFIDAKDPKFIGTIEAAERYLRKGDYLYRYHAADDFGEPETAFNICTFWYISALAQAGRETEARELFEHMLSRRNPVGLLSEDMDVKTGELWGNFPQTYSLVGMINAAMKLSKPWEEAF
ncbi:MAG: glycoside hydrolase family 15 protein [Azospirillaceae bacterium]